MSSHQNGTPSSPRPDISLPENRPRENGKRTAELDAKFRANVSSNFSVRPPNTLPRAFYPGGDRALSGIALRAFLLGSGAVLGAVLAVVLAYYDSRLWRPPFFLAALCIFHFLEFWTTAEYNTPNAYIAAFLLTNGSRYRQAHTFAFFESFITSYFFGEWQARIQPPWLIALGFAMILVGQIVRTFAMVQAGTNFNHLVQSRKNEGHELVTTGWYSIFRHPSYFGFFWWGLGTQVALGNVVSFAAYSAILWYFFKKRIRHEEKHLIEFFGDDYRAYKARTRVWIPFIW
ncbi:prenyl cysteine carboxyl methyltransferas-like protein Ste14 [Lophiostoma macrostomum CBS 122681]|uniref:Protein-S-isoprenylcysteine O-methyltransferase n=1 Tax=Lophiostoma macrostomum CBS 122681 TaxID=1314788 RepID=A0A6A6SR24_9PLEO|nr:prenyl cysteine carboxyl methyltransferas-like protein Ste14 [Lophiostoma macrostomum CBS 122681]